MSRAAIPSSHPTVHLTVRPAAPDDPGRRALVDVPAGPDVSSGDDALPVLLAPGFTGSKEDFTPLLDILAGAGHRVVAVDLAGQWQSSGSADPSAYSPELLAADLPQLLDQLGIERAHLVGHSFGGLVSRAAVLAVPSRFASLTLLCSGPAAISETRRSSVELVAEAAAGMPLGDLYDAMLDYWRSHDQQLPPPAALPFQRERFTTGVAAAVTGMGRALLAEPDRVAELRGTATDAAVPLHVVHGEDDDAWTPAEQADMAERLGTTAVVISGAGHSPAYEATDATAKVLLGLWS